MNCQDHLYRNPRNRAPLVPQAMRRRPRRGGARPICSPARGAAAVDPLAAEDAALRAQGQARHLPLHGRRARATWSCSTTSRSSPSSTARCRPPSCSRATAPRSSIRTRSCSARSSSSASTARAAPSCPSCCRTLARSSTTSRSSSRWRPTRSITRPARLLMNTGSQQFGRPSMGAWIALRPRQRDRRTCPASSSSAPATKGPSGGNSLLGQRLPADRLPGRAVPQRRRPGAVPVEPARRRRRAAARLARRRQAAQPTCASTTSGDPEIATRINSYEMAFRMQAERAGADGHRQGAEGHARDVRRRAGQAVVRQQLPARPPAGRARRAVRRSSSTRPGTSTATSCKDLTEELPRHRPAPARR